MKIVTTLNAEAAYRYAAERCVQWLETALRHGDATLVAAGGSTFVPLYRLLSGAYADSIDWHRVTILMGDERCLPEGDTRSNGSMIRKEFIDRFPEGMRPRFLPIISSIQPESAAASYDLIIPERLTVSLLGMGPDGHTASLFAGSRPQWEDNRVIVTKGERAPFVQRITLTPAAFARSEHILVLVIGNEKAEALHATVADSEGTYPVARIAAAVLDLVMVLDADAATGLSDSPSLAEPGSEQDSS